MKKLFLISSLTVLTFVSSCKKDDPAPAGSSSNVTTRPLIYGCKDPKAKNYNVHADIDDGSCKY